MHETAQIGKQVEKTLKDKYITKTINVSDNLNEFIDDLNSFKPDIVFNALHGNFGEDGQVQSILNLLKTPYTHSICFKSYVVITHGTFGCYYMYFFIKKI